MVLALAEALGAENFASLFEVEQSLAPTKAYTESSCQFPAETRAALNLVGVRQIVAPAVDPSYLAAHGLWPEEVSGMRLISIRSLSTDF